MELLGKNHVNPELMRSYAFLSKSAFICGQKIFGISYLSTILLCFFFVLFQICVHLRSSAAKNSLEFFISPSFDKFGAFSHVFKCEPKRIDPEKFSFSLKFSTA